ncbi:50S ribosomal protein L4 [Candidatus Vidania fulgoroideorum]
MIINDFYFFFFFKINLKNLIFFLKIYNFNNKKKISKQKSRGELNYSNIKPWKQKGTGKARAGTKSSPIWKGGGRSFPSYPSFVKKKILKKNYKKIFNYLIGNGFMKKKIFFVDFSKFFIFKTYYFLNFIKNFINYKKNIKILFVFENKFLKLCSRNLKFNIIDPRYLNSFYIIKNELIFLDLKILKKHNEIFKNN